METASLLRMEMIIRVWRGLTENEAQWARPDDPDTNFYNADARVYAKFAPVPVPAAVWLLGSGLIGLLGIRRKFKK
jgi:hypothetical protein